MPEVTRNGEKNSSGADGLINCKGVTATLDTVTFSVNESTGTELKAGWYEHKSHSTGFVSKIVFCLVNGTCTSLTRYACSSMQKYHVAFGDPATTTEDMNMTESG